MNLKKLLMLKSAGGASPYVTETATGNPAMFETNVAKRLKKLLIPLNSESGYSGIAITACGLNLFDKTAATQGKYINSSGAVVDAPTGYNWSMTDFIPVNPGGTVTYRRNGGTGTSPYSAWYKADKTLISAWKQQASMDDATIRSESVPANAAYVRISFLYTDLVADNFMVVTGNGSIQAYAPYTGETHSVVFPESVKSGSFDAVTGILTVTSPQAATYNLDPVLIDSLIGVNNIWTDTDGSNTVKYVKKVTE